jgi:putative effector of murein hydrolase
VFPPLVLRLFEQRQLLLKMALPIAGGAVITTVVSFIFTVLFSRALSLPPQVRFDHNIDASWTPILISCRLQVGLGLAPRFITLPIAMPIAETLGSSTSIAAMGTVLQGVIGANITLKVTSLTRSKAYRIFFCLRRPHHRV